MLRRALDKIEEEAGETRVQGHLDFATRPLFREPWPRHRYHGEAALRASGRRPNKLQSTQAGTAVASLSRYMMANLRLVLAVDVAPGNEHTSKHSAPRLWKLLEALTSEQRPWRSAAIPDSATSQ